MVPSTDVIRKSDHEHRALLSLAVAALLAELAYAILNLSALPMYVSFVLKQQAWLAVVIPTFLLTEALSRPWFGALGDRIGRKPLLIAGPLVTAVTAYLTIKLQGPYAIWGLVALKAIDGLGSGALWMNAFAAVGDIADEQHHSAAMSMLNVTYMSGMALGFLLGGAVNQLFNSYLASFYLVSGLLAVSVVVMFFLLPKKIGGPHQEHIARDVPSHDHVELTTLEEAPAQFRISNLLRCFREVPDMIVLACVIFLGIGTLIPIVKLYAVQHLGLTETQFGLAVAPVAAAMGICAVPMGRLGDKYGRCVAVCWGLFGSAIALWVLALFRNIIFDALAGVVIGLGFTLAFPAWMALIASSTTASRRGEVIGAVGAAQGLAAIVGAALGALVYSSDRLSFPRLGVVNYNVPFWWSAILMSVGTVLAFTWMCRRNSERDTGDGIRPGQRKLVVLSAAVGLIALVLWIGWRYTQPVAPERVAWEWVQQLYRGRPHKAARYTLPSAAGGWNGLETSRTTSRTFVRYKKKLGALWYTVFPPRTISDDRVEVPVRFVLHNLKDSKWVQIAVCKPPSSREWKVCGIRYGE